MRKITELGKTTRQEIVKWNQMTAVRFQTGGDIRHYVQSTIPTLPCTQVRLSFGNHMRVFFSF